MSRGCHAFRGSCYDTRISRSTNLDCVQDNVRQGLAWNEPLASQLCRGLSWTLLLATTELL